MSLSASGVSLEAGEALCRALESLGASHVFCLPGTQTVPLFEALRRSRLTAIVPTHELAASMMAGAFFRVSGRPGVLLTIPGPGFTYALTGLAEARLDSAAMIHFVPAVDEGPQSRFGLQAIPQTALASALAKAALRAGTPLEVADAVAHAHALALAGEPGPVVVQLDAHASNAKPNLAPTVPPSPGSDKEAASLWARVRAARHPVIFAGQGCLHSAAALQAFAEELHAPVVTTASARGVVPEDHRLAMAFDAHRGTSAAASALLETADLVMVLGAKLGHNGTAGHALRFDPARTVRVDTDETALDAAGGRSGFLVMSVAEFLSSRGTSPLPVSAWSEADLRDLKRTIRSPAPGSAEPTLAGQPAVSFFAALQAALPRNTIVVTDTGLHQVLARRHLDVLSSGGLLLPTDFQSMGFGLPAAIAARLAAPERPVVLLIGDGGIAMCGMELATAVRLGLPIPVIVFDDGKLNQIRLHQQAEFGQDFGVVLPTLDFEALATATGAAFTEIGSALRDDLDAAFSAQLPTLLRLRVGDSAAIRRTRQTARAKALIRGALGGRLMDRLRRLRGRT